MICAPPGLKKKKEVPSVSDIRFEKIVGCSESRVISPSIQASNVKSPDPTALNATLSEVIRCERPLKFTQPEFCASELLLPKASKKISWIIRIVEEKELNMKMLGLIMYNSFWLYHSKKICCL